MKNFDRNWWYNFLKKSENLSKPIILENVLDEEINELYGLIRTLLIKVGPNNVSKSCRFWLDGNPLSTIEIEKSINTLENSKNILEWVETNLSSHDFGIILNSCQNQSLEIKSYFFNRIASLVDVIGIPSDGFDVTLFAGNYSKTPLGFHLDPEGHQVIHLHLGPGDKEMLLIPKEMYEKKLFSITNGESGFQDVDLIKEHATVFKIKRGDIFFMPYGMYHIGQNNDFSISATVWMMNQSMVKFSNLFLNSIFHDLNGTLQNYDQEEEISKSVLQKIKLEDGNIKLSELIVGTLNDQKLKLSSNSFFHQNFVTPNQKTTSKLSSSNIVRGNSPDKIFYSPNNDNIYLYIQGHKISFPHNSGIRTFLDLINSYAEIPVSRLMLCLGDDWDEDTCLYFINYLLELNAASVVK